MATMETACQCGEKLTVLSGKDCQTSLRVDGKQVIYTEDERPRNYCIFRCRTCRQVVHDSCEAAALGERQ